MILVNERSGSEGEAGAIVRKVYDSREFATVVREVPRTSDGEGTRNSGRNRRQRVRFWEECGEMRLKWSRGQRVIVMSRVAR